MSAGGAYELSFAFSMASREFWIRVFLYLEGSKHKLASHSA